MRLPKPLLIPKKLINHFEQYLRGDIQRKEIRKIYNWIPGGTLTRMYNKFIEEKRK